MFEVVILQPAQQDIRKAAHWYNDRDPGLGRRFTAAIRENIEVIKNYPESAPLRYENIRTSPIEKFPFMIHYRVENKNHRIVVSAVFHTSLSPERWDER